MKSKKRDCPECLYWVFTRDSHMCLKDYNRPTNTTYDLSSEYAYGPCGDYRTIKLEKVRKT